MSRSDQYRVEIRTSSGAEVMLRKFLVRKRVGDMEMSAREAVRKVRVARVRPIMVRYWKCQP